VTPPATPATDGPRCCLGALGEFDDSLGKAAIRPEDGSCGGGDGGAGLPPTMILVVMVVAGIELLPTREVDVVTSVTGADAQKLADMVD
jgi:hypothetical protein